VVGLEWLDDPESYADGSASAGRVSLAGQVKGDDRLKWIPWLSKLGVGKMR